MEESGMISKEMIELAREQGKAGYFNPDATPEERSEALGSLIFAQRNGDAEAEYLIARLFLDGRLGLENGDSLKYALRLMCNSANRGYAQARAHLNVYCEEKYRKQFKEELVAKKDGPLTGFDGKKISFVRKGLLTPIDATLEYKDGENILNIGVNITFLYTEQTSDPAKFEEAILSGIRLWEGEYTVFGGQKVSVRMDITTEERIFDTVIIAPIVTEIADKMEKLSEKFGTENKKTEIRNLISSRRSFATGGLRWSVTSRKFIFMQSESPDFDDYDELMHVAKHEFGHALGLGDLYESPSDHLDGVTEGTFAELDSYIINNKFYNLVMCDHHGPISNNDIEMVILAFKKNRMQLFQPRKLKRKISEALGRGN